MYKIPPEGGGGGGGGGGGLLAAHGLISLGNSTLALYTKRLVSFMVLQFFSLKIIFVLANSVDPDECHIMRHLIWIFSV